MDVFQFSGDIDYRQLSLSDKRRFFTPVNKKNKSKINVLWSELTDGTSAPLKLNVKSREVIIPAFCNGVGRAYFNDLCEKPLGPSDFLVIAKSVRVLIIEEIPKNNNRTCNVPHVPILRAWQTGKLANQQTGKPANQQILTPTPAE